MPKREGEYAYRKRVVRGRTRSFDVIVEIMIGSADEELTREEHEALLDAAASRAMLAIPDLPYVDIPLSRVKVR